MYNFKIWLWKNGHKHKEYTKYMVEPFFYEDRLDETLDTAEVILDSMPISEKTAFPPKTKFRIEMYSDGDENPIEKYDMVVEHDDVEEYVNAPDICCHRIHLIEPSVIAQGMHVDNIALTYELQDVTLNYRTTKSDELGETITGKLSGKNRERYDRKLVYGTITTKPEPETSYFENSYSYSWENYEELSNSNKLLDGTVEHKISFDIPKLKCFHFNGENLVELFEVSTITKVFRRYIKGDNVDWIEIAEYTNGPSVLPKNNNQSVCVIPTEIEPDAMYFANIRTLEYGLDTHGNPKDVKRSWYFFRGKFDTPITHIEENEVERIEITTEYFSEAKIESGYGCEYKIEIYPKYTNCLLTYYKAKHTGYDNGDVYGTLLYCGKTAECTNEITYASVEDLTISAVFKCTNRFSIEESDPFLKKAEKYSCYNLLQKALLTTDTQMIYIGEHALTSDRIQMYEELNYENKYSPIIVDSNWVEKLKNTTMFESVFENKNLWEILLQIGYYLHAIPYLEFVENLGNDDKDRLLLSFKQLGGNEKNADKCCKLTVFNSRNLSDFFTVYDSYVTNLYSPQNVVEEWITPKTSSSEYLIYNDVAELHVTHGILEIVEFKISYNDSDYKDATNHIFEETIYKILTSDYKISPGKANSLYYTLGDTKICGLNYIPPSQKNDQLMALKKIVQQLFKGGEYWADDTDSSKLKFNDLRFYVKYRTQDSARITQIRPDIENFMKNTFCEQFPHHEQFFGQQDKIIDSERFGTNAYGKLIRCGNEIYQKQEYVNAENMKRSGQLVKIKNKLYYATAVDNEFYRESVFQKVTYSRDFNQLSQICTIPSEPRFYEVSERSSIRREIRLVDFVKISPSRPEGTIQSPRFIADWRNFIKNTIFYESAPAFPNYAFTTFIADKKRKHYGSNGEPLNENGLFPSSEPHRYDENELKNKNVDRAESILPLLRYPIHNSLVFEWDMEDNFKAGDYTDTAIEGQITSPKRPLDIKEDGAYYAQQALRYCDIMGRADLFMFALFKKSDWTSKDAKDLPKVPKEFQISNAKIQSPTDYALGLDKDNREAISFNYQITLLYDDFTVYPNVWGEKKRKLKVMYRKDIISKFEQSIDLFDSEKIVAEGLNMELENNNEKEAIEIVLPTQKNNESIDKSQIGSIVIYDEESEKLRSIYIVRNVLDLDNEDKLKSWWIHPI